jgi:Niemann-Pick C1 protein
MRSAWQLLAGLVLIAANQAKSEPYTPIHEAGRCSIRGNCGKKSVFGRDLPCPDNGLAEDPTDDVRKQLVNLCGPKWSTGPVCCEAAQVCMSRFSLNLHANNGHRLMLYNLT